jgi:hypothetical protein
MIILATSGNWITSLEYAFILCDGGFIQSEHLPEPFYTPSSVPPQAKVEPLPTASQTIEEFEKQAIYL